MQVFQVYFYFLVQFYTNHIKFHILIMICVLCYILYTSLFTKHKTHGRNNNKETKTFYKNVFYKNAQKESELCIGYSSWVEILCSVLFRAGKNLGFLEKVFRFFQVLKVFLGLFKFFRFQCTNKTELKISTQEEYPIHNSLSVRAFL